MGYIVYTISKPHSFWERKGVLRMADRHKPGYHAEFDRANYDKVSLLLPKGKRQVLKDYAAKRGESVNRVIIDAIEKACGINLTD